MLTSVLLHDVANAMAALEEAERKMCRDWPTPDKATVDNWRCAQLTSVAQITKLRRELYGETHAR